MPYSQARESALWSETDWLEEKVSFRSNEGLAVSQVSTLTPQSLLIPIEQVPLGARVPTKNPRPWEYDDSLPEPIQSEWAQISVTLHRNDGGIVDAELIRPRSWIKHHGIQANTRLPINIPELEATGLAFVNSVEDCPEIAMGEGSVITGRFLTRQVDEIAQVEIRGADGTIETLEGTTIHPIWSLDRNDWVPLGELEEGERLQGQAGPAVVRTIAILCHSNPVYNVEVQGEHVYEVGIVGCIVHNACDLILENGENAIGFMTNSGKLLGQMSKNIAGGHEELAYSIPNVVALCRSGQAFGFSVCKSSQGIKTVFQSGLYQHASGTIPGHLKNIILGIVD